MNRQVFRTRIHSPHSGSRCSVPHLLFLGQDCQWWAQLGELSFGQGKIMPDPYAYDRENQLSFHKSLQKTEKRKNYKCMNRKK